MQVYRLKINPNVDLIKKKLGFRTHLLDFIIKRPSLMGGIFYDGLFMKNRLLKNHYEIIRGLLNNVNVSILDTAGNSKNARTSGDFAHDIARIYVGEDTVDLDFSDYNLTNFASDVCSLVELLSLTNSNKVRVSGLAAKTGTSVGLALDIFDASGSSLYVMLSARLLSVSSGESVLYDLVFNQPWVYNFANWFYGLAKNTDAPNEKDLGGVTYTLRSSADAQAEACRIVTGDGTDEWSPTDYSLSSPVEHETSFHSWVTDYAVEYVWRTWYIPPSDEQINEIGLVQKLYDSGGGQHDTLLCRIALGASPLNLTGGNYYIIRLRIVGS